MWQRLLPLFVFVAPVSAQQTWMHKRLTYFFLIIAISALPDFAHGQARVITWGDSAPTTDNRSDLVSISCSYDSIVAITTSGELVSWGSVGTPPAGNDFVDIGTSRFTAFAVDANGQLHAWGDPDTYQLTNVPGGSDFIAVEGGTTHALALRRDGTIVCWGRNFYGQLNAPPESGFVDIAAGDEWSQAMRADGTIVTWGYDQDRQVRDTPSSPGFVDLGGGHLNVHAVSSSGEIISWGQNRGNTVSNTPTDSGYIAVDARSIYVAAALKADGSIVVWGDDRRGQISGAPSGAGFEAVEVGSSWCAALIPDDDQDLDDDGVLNSEESGVYFTDPNQFDTDGDGLSDGQEIGLTTANIGKDTRIQVFRPDADPSTTTDPLNADSDGGGMSDGQEDFNLDGAYQYGEFDPNQTGDDRFRLNVPQLIPGTTASITVGDARPGSTGALFYSLAGPGPTPTAYGFTFDLSAPFVRHQIIYLSGGNGTFTLDVPPQAPPGLSVWMQAVEKLYYADAYRTSDAWAGVIQ